MDGFFFIRNTIHGALFYPYFCLAVKPGRHRLFEPSKSMEENELIKRLSGVITKHYLPELVALGETGTLSVTTLHRLCYTPERSPVAFRAAWVLEYIATRAPQRFLPVFAAFMTRLPDQRNPSCQRHFTKILMVITGPKAPPAYQDAYATTDKEQLVETVFGWLINPQTPVAVQVNCMDILFNLTAEFGWIGEELQNQVEFLLRDGSAALQSRGRKIIGKLKKLKTAG
ncbi:hypothetical protein [Parapedobacter lycopersici]|uniref:hypothetical protein n=1 Tax=Parapedobacter lycopersici TaxID=1864939 RepID=UPI00214D1884|nr:hypothetical protein [Parapedobacter lycopersici]